MMDHERLFQYLENLGPNPANDDIKPSTISKQLGISRACVYDALRVLSSDGLINEKIGHKMWFSR